MTSQCKQLSAMLFAVFCMSSVMLAGARPVMAQQNQAAKPAPEGSPGTFAAAQAAPSAQVDETTFDFGEVFEGSTVIHDFRVKNTGVGDLQITQVRPG